MVGMEVVVSMARVSMDCQVCGQARVDMEAGDSAAPFSKTAGPTATLRLECVVGSPKPCEATRPTLSGVLGIS